MYTERKPIAQSERILIEIWDKVDELRDQHGETIATARAQRALRALIEDDKGGEDACAGGIKGASKSRTGHGATPIAIGDRS